MEPLSIRVFEPRDKDALVRICCETGYMGESIAGKFADRKLFALIFLLPNVLYSPGSCFVAEVGSEVVGYCLVEPDTERFQTWFRKNHKVKIIRHLIFWTVWRYPLDAMRIFRRSFVRGVGEKDIVEHHYPAHFHINVLAAHQRAGIGQSLTSVALNYLKSKHVPGIHLKTSSRNHAALNFYKKLGFETLYTDKNNFWGIDEVISVCMGLKLS